MRVSAATMARSLARAGWPLKKRPDSQRAGRDCPGRLAGGGGHARAGRLRVRRRERHPHQLDAGARPGATRGTGGGRRAAPPWPQPHAVCRADPGGDRPGAGDGRRRRGRGVRPLRAGVVGAEPAPRPGGDPGPAQRPPGRRDPGGRRSGGLPAAAVAGLLAGLQPHRAGLRQHQDPPAPGRGAGPSTIWSARSGSPSTPSPRPTRAAASPTAATTSPLHSYATRSSVAIAATSTPACSEVSSVPPTRSSNSKSSLPVRVTSTSRFG